MKNGLFMAFFVCGIKPKGQIDGINWIILNEEEKKKTSDYVETVLYIRDA